MNYPIKIKLVKKNLEITWDNEIIHKIPLQFLRDESPDAGNKGETILWKHYEPLPQGPDKPGKYEVENIVTVGDYAIQIKWKDGYDYGIYSWDLLWRLGEYISVKENLHQDFEHDHKDSDHHHNKKDENNKEKGT